MTDSSMWEIWHKGDTIAVRHIVGRYSSQQEADKAWKRLTLFAKDSEANKYQMLTPSVAQQLELKARAIEEKGRAQPVAPRLPFDKILMSKIDAKKKQYAWLERQEREKKFIDNKEEKLKISGGIAALKWAHTEWMQSTQMNLTGVNK